MAEDTKLVISDRNNVQPVFVSQVIGQGVVNGVINLTFGTYLFTPNSENKIDPDMVVSARVRMDIACAKQLHDSLRSLLGLDLAPSNATTH